MGVQSPHDSLCHASLPRLQEIINHLKRTPCTSFLHVCINVLHLLVIVEHHLIRGDASCLDSNTGKSRTSSMPMVTSNYDSEHHKQSRCVDPTISSHDRTVQPSSNVGLRCTRSMRHNRDIQSLGVPRSLMHTTKLLCKVQVVRLS